MDSELPPDSVAKVQATFGYNVHGGGPKASVSSPVNSKSDLEYDWQLHLLPSIVPVVGPAIGAIDCYR